MTITRNGVRLLFTACVGAVLLFALAGCEVQANPSADVIQAQQTRQAMQQAQAEVGVPGITNWTEKRFQKEIYELRDETFTTYTYFVDMNGRLHFVCESLGYGLPYSAQYTNPTRTVQTWANGGIEQLPQPEPNGLFVPEGLAATWVLCATPGGGVAPIYSEPELLVSPFPLPSVNGPSAAQGAGAASVSVDLTSPGS